MHVFIQEALVIKIEMLFIVTKQPTQDRLTNHKYFYQGALVSLSMPW